MDSRSRTLRRISKTTSTSCGIGWHRAATFRRRCDRWTYRRTMGEPGRWGYPRSPTASPRWWSKELEPLVEPPFHDDSYGYRPGKSALDAVGVARQRCWRYDG